MQTDPNADDPEHRIKWTLKLAERDPEAFEAGAFAKQPIIDELQAKIARLEAERTAAIAAAYRKGLVDAAGVAEKCAYGSIRHDVETEAHDYGIECAVTAIRALDTQDSRTTHATGEKP